MRLREIRKEDIHDILRIRVSTRENHFNMEHLAEVGVTPQSVAEWLEGPVKGWLCEVSGKPVGFAMADCATAEVIVVACYPEFENQGIGKMLMLKLHDWLWSFEHKEIWLWSNPDPSVRAYGFYRKLGYRPTGDTQGNNEMLKLKKMKS